MVNHTEAAALNITAAFEGGSYSAIGWDPNGGLSFGRYQFTEKSSNLQRLISAYLEESTSEAAQNLREYLGGLRELSTYNALLIAVGRDPVMQRLQDRLAVEWFYKPAIRQFADPLGECDPLCYAFVFDAVLHHGAANVDSRIMLEARLRFPRAKGREFWYQAAIIRRDWLRRLAAAWNMPGLAQRGEWWVIQMEAANWRLHGDNNGELMVKPGRWVKVDSVATKYDMRPYLFGSGTGKVYRLEYGVNPLRQGGHLIQTVHENGYVFHVKGGAPTGCQWEARRANLAKGTIDFYADTSQGMSECYTLHSAASGAMGSAWMPLMMEIGVPYFRDPLVKYWYKDGRFRYQQVERTWITLIAIHDEYTFPNGVKRRNVAELWWTFTPDIEGESTAAEKYFYNGGLLGWQGRTHPYASYPSIDPVDPNITRLQRETVSHIQLPEVVNLFPDLNDPRWADRYVTPKLDYTNVRSSPEVAPNNISGRLSGREHVQILFEAKIGLWLPVKYSDNLTAYGWVYGTAITLSEYAQPTGLIMLPAAEVPFVPQLGTGADQTSNDCGRASGSTLIRRARHFEALRLGLQYAASVYVTPDAISRQMASGNSTISTGQLQQLLREYGVWTQILIRSGKSDGLTLSVIDHEIEQGRPVLPLVNYPGVGGHFMVIVGKDSHYIYAHNPLKLNGAAEAFTRPVFDDMLSNTLSAGNTPNQGLILIAEFDKR